MKLYSLLILTENKKINNKKSEALQMTKLVLFPSHILPCKRTCARALYKHFIPRLSTVSDGMIKACITTYHKAPLLIGLRTRKSGDSPRATIVCPTQGRRHQHVAQCCANIQPSFRYTNRRLGAKGSYLPL